MGKILIKEGGRNRRFSREFYKGKGNIFPYKIRTYALEVRI